MHLPAVAVAAGFVAAVFMVALCAPGVSTAGHAPLTCVAADIGLQDADTDIVQYPVAR